MANKCLCGCGQSTTRNRNKRGNFNDYIHGHNSVGKTWQMKLVVKRRQSHSRALRIYAEHKNCSTCEINDNVCSGRLEIAHLDQDFLNNEPSNLAKLCLAHHKLLDHGKRTFSELKSTKFVFYVDKSGHRRYKYGD
jgi:hypothetical protein